MCAKVYNSLNSFVCSFKVDWVKLAVGRQISFIVIIGVFIFYNGLYCNIVLTLITYIIIRTKKIVRNKRLKFAFTRTKDCSKI